MLSQLCLYLAAFKVDDAGRQTGHGAQVAAMGNQASRLLLDSREDSPAVQFCGNSPGTTSACLTFAATFRPEATCAAKKFVPPIPQGTANPSGRLVLAPLTQFNAVRSASVSKWATWPLSRYSPGTRQSCGVPVVDTVPHYCNSPSNILVLQHSEHRTSFASYRIRAKLSR